MQSTNCESHSSSLLSTTGCRMNRTLSYTGQDVALAFMVREEGEKAQNTFNSLTGRQRIFFLNKVNRRFDIQMVALT